jgi:hypothetical protein
MCDRALLFFRGHLVADVDPNEEIEQYRTTCSQISQPDAGTD